MVKELDQILAQYRQHLKKIAVSLAQMTHLSQCDMMLSKDAEGMIERLERAVAKLMDKEVLVDKAKQDVLDLKMVLDVSRQTVEAKSMHLSQEEKQKEEELTCRFKEFQRIHKLQDEKSSLEKELVPVKRRLTELTKVLDENYEKKRILENFHDTLAEHCAQDMIFLKDRTDESRADRSKWDRADLDIMEEIRGFGLDQTEIKNLGASVCDVRETLKNQKLWYDEEMHTKLFYSTRSKEIKHRISYLRNLLRRLEKTGRSEDLNEELEEKRYNRIAEDNLVDGTPGVDAKEVERYLSHQFGIKVLADYTMLRRLKDEIGVQGLAYLVEKVRLQGARYNSNAPLSGSCMDWEEKQIEQALMSIALEYRDRDENRRMLRVPGVSPYVSKSPDDMEQRSPASDALMPSLSRLSTASIATTARTTIPDDSMPCSNNTSRSSSLSAKRKPSLARIKKLLKF